MPVRTGDAESRSSAVAARDRSPHAANAATEAKLPGARAGSDTPGSAIQSAAGPGGRSLPADLARMGGLTALTVISFLWIFPPHAIWPLAFVCLAPWAYAVITAQRGWVAHWGSFLGGWFFFLFATRWLMPVTGLGFVALAFYLALYWPAAAWAIRAGLRHGISPIWTLPIAWVATEYMRGWVMSGFPWFFIGHAFWEQTHFIQICDLTGAYGVSFLALLVSGVLVEFALQRRRRAMQPRRGLQLRWGALTTAVVVVATLAYGWFRIDEYPRVTRPGPKVAVVQENYPLESQPPYHNTTFVKILSDYIAGAAAAAVETKPDLLVLPETVWSGYQNKQFLAVPQRAVDDIQPWAWSVGTLIDNAIAALARGDYAHVTAALDRLPLGKDESHRPLPRNGPPVTLVMGSLAVEVNEGEVYPATRKYNSALVYDAAIGQRDKRYDKVHLVPFGELVPFRTARFIGIDMHWLYRWLNSLSPFSRGGTIEYTLTPGAKFSTFDLTTAGGTYRFGVPICYEDVMPYVSRFFVWNEGKRRADFLVNISNDGWFREAELPQHLAICVFRAVENRVPIARAVNTGISGFIDSCGRVGAVVEVNGKRTGPEVAGFQSGVLRIDNRGSLYGWLGDWFAAFCMVSGGALWVEAIIARWLFAIRRRWRRARGRRAGQSVRVEASN